MATLQQTGITGSLEVSASSISNPTIRAVGTGSVFEVSGSRGQLMQVNDIVSGSLFSVNTGSSAILDIGSDRILKLSGSAIISGSAPIELLVIGDTVITGSVIISGSSGIELTVRGDTIVTGSFVATSNVFSKGGTAADSNGISSNISYNVWRAPFSCSVVAVYGRREGGSTAQINARKSSSAGYSLHTGSNLTLGTVNSWTATNTVVSTSYVAGDSLEIVISGSGGSPTQVSVQVDFVKV